MFPSPQNGSGAAPPNPPPPRPPSPPEPVAGAPDDRADVEASVPVELVGAAPPSPAPPLPLARSPLSSPHAASTPARAITRRRKGSERCSTTASRYRRASREHHRARGSASDQPCSSAPFAWP